MANFDTQIRVQELSGIWTTIGSGKGAGITLSDGSAGADQWGSRECSFTLRRNPRAMWPDIGAFTPVEVEIGGVLVWSGRVKETPSRDGDDRQMTVTCEGYQYHLDDDVYQRAYVIADPTKWQDARTYPGCRLGQTEFAAAAQVTTDNFGAITMQWPNQVPIVAASRMGIVLDLGPNSTAVAFSLEYFSSANSGSNLLYVRTYNTPIWGSSEVVIGTCFEGGQNSVYTSGTLNGSFSVPGRFVHIFDYCSPTGYTPGADVWWRFPAIRIFTSGGYVATFLTPGTSSTSAGPDTSILRADHVVADAISKATLLLSSDVSKIDTTTTFYIPDFSLSGYTTPREAINAVNIFENKQARVLVDKRLEYRTKPIDVGTVAFQVDEEAGAVFEDTSANSGEQIYSDVAVEATGADGLPILARRSQPSSLYIASSLSLANPSFDTNLTGWFPNTGVFVRDTVVFDSGGASLKITPGAGAYVSGPITTSALTGTLVAGRSYRLSFAVRRGGAYVSGLGFDPYVSIYDSSGVLGFTYVPQASLPVVDTWYTLSVDFVPSRDSTLANMGVTTFGWNTADGTKSVWLDSFFIYEATPTIVQKRGFKRTFVLNTNMNLTTVAANQIGDKFLSQHLTTPLKGSLTVSGSRGVKRAQGGNGVAPYELLLNAGEQMLFPHITNPDNGAVGRTGVIDSVTYNLITGEANVSIDNTRSNFDSLLARLAIVTGQVR